MMPPTVTQSLSLRSVSSPSWQSVRAPQRGAQRLQGMRGDEQADRLLLDREQLRLLELLAGDRWVGGPREGRRRAVADAEGRAGAARAGGLGRWGEIEDRTLADLQILLGLLAAALGLLEHLQHPLAARAGGAERAALDQRVDRLLVDGATVHTLAEVPQRAELSPLLARALDRLDGLEADALDGVEAEADLALDNGELVV